MCFENIDLSICEIVLRTVCGFLEEFETWFVPEELGGQRARGAGWRDSETGAYWFE